MCCQINLSVIFNFGTTFICAMLNSLNPYINFCQSIKYLYVVSAGVEKFNNTFPILFYILICFIQTFLSGRSKDYCLHCV